MVILLICVFNVLNVHLECEILNWSSTVESHRTPKSTAKWFSAENKWYV